MINDYYKKLQFLKSFSEEELYYNEHKRKDLPALLSVYDSILPFIKPGKYLELGCGTGMLCSFINAFSDKEIIPYGVDCDPEAVELVGKRMPQFKNNFKQQDYFAIPARELIQFETISFFVDREKNSWQKLTNKVQELLKIKPDAYLLIFSYDYDLQDIKHKRVLDFIKQIEPLANIKKVNQRFFIINNQ